MHVRSVLVAAGVLVLTFASAQVTQSGAKYTFKIKWEKGKTYAFKMTVKASAAGKPMTFSTTNTMTVKDVVKGVATLSVKSDAPGSPKEPQTAKVDANGKVLQGSPAFSLTFAPAGAIPVGHKWADTTGQGANATKTNFVFNGIKTINGKKFAEIGVKSNGSQPGGAKVSGSGTMLYTPADGMLHRFTFAGKVTEGGKSTPTDVTIVRVK